jgi:hypothetical protein
LSDKTYFYRKERQERKVFLLDGLRDRRVLGGKDTFCHSISQNQKTIKN